MSTISSSTQAMLATRNLEQSQDLLNRSLNRLSSGSKISNPADDSAGVAKSGKLDAQSLRVQAASVNVQNAVSYVQSADDFMGSMTKVLSRMSELSSLAKDATKSPSDVALYQKEFSALQDQLRATIGGTTAEIGGTTGVPAPLGAFNGTALFDSSSGTTVSVGAMPGDQITIPGANLRTGPMLSLINQDSSGNYTITSSDSSALATIADTVSQMATQRASLGAAQSRLGLAGTTLQVEAENLSSTVSRIRDVDVATESTQLAKYNILVQSSTSMLAQANQQPASVLKLLHQ